MGSGHRQSCRSASDARLGLPRNRATAANLSPVLLAHFGHALLDLRAFRFAGRVRQQYFEPLQLLISPRPEPGLGINNLGHGDHGSTISGAPELPLGPLSSGIMKCVPSAQDTFALMLRSQVAPALRRAGFKGSRQAFELPSTSTWRILGFQKSTLSDARRVKFTVNLTVVDRAAWEEARLAHSYIPAKPNANIRGGVGWESRIGTLMPEGNDKWWEVRANERTDSLAVEVVDAIICWAVPAMENPPT